jgi:uncharacterized protein (TIGR03118 family)
MSRTLKIAVTALLVALPLTGRIAGKNSGNVVVLETDLVSNVPGLIDGNGIVHNAFTTDANLVNPWGITAGPTTPFWIADNNAGVSTLYAVPPAGSPPVSIVPRVFTIPGPENPLDRVGTPTGAVFNTVSSAGAFKVSGVTNGGVPTSAAAAFIFATEDGTIVGWSPNTVMGVNLGVNPQGFNPSLAGTYGIIAVDHSAIPSAAAGAVYKGLAIATDASGSTFLYVTNFRAATIEVYDVNFKPVTNLPAGAFVDPHLPNGYAPFNIVHIGNNLFVTYAKQDAAKHDDVALPAHGLVDIFDLSGKMLSRFTQHAHLNSPWGVVQVPASFGDLAGAILIGNFGDGRIHAFDPDSGKELGSVTNSIGQEIVIDGLWSLTVGTGSASGGDKNTIYFTAGPNGETAGLFGSLSFVSP